MKIAISADSTTSISQDEAKKLGVFILPLNVIVDDKEYHDGITINQKSLKEFMRKGSKITTSTPTPFEIGEYFDNIFSKGFDKIIHFTISSKLSSMYNLFLVTCKEKYGDKVIVIDSLSVCSFMGNLIKKAKSLNDEGESLENIIKSVEKNINSDDIYFIPESLTFLKNGGRVSPAVAIIGNLIGIKPVLRFTNGLIAKHSTTRTTKKGYLTILNNLKERNLDPKEYELHILEFDSMPIVKEVHALAKNMFPKFDILITPISINVCAHAGPGTVGIGMAKK